MKIDDKSIEEIAARTGYKLVKSKVLSSAYHETFVDFCGTVSGFVDNLHDVCAVDMRSLITENFQIINNLQIIANVVPVLSSTGKPTACRFVYSSTMAGIKPFE